MKNKYSLEQYPSQIPGVAKGFTQRRQINRWRAAQLTPRQERELLHCYACDGVLTDVPSIGERVCHNPSCRKYGPE